MLNRFSLGLAAGLLISVGGSVFLNCENKVVGAVFFSVALLCICMKGYSLYTGKICYVIDDHSPAALSTLFLGLLGNIVATVLVGLAVRYAVPSIGAAAEIVCASKLASQTIFQTLIRGVMCGALVYLSVAIYREKNTPIGILFCIPTFILSGFEHSIADMFYFAASGTFTLDNVIFIAVVVIGNSIGGLLLPVLQNLGKGKTA